MSKTLRATYSQAEAGYSDSIASGPFSNLRTRLIKRRKSLTNIPLVQAAIPKALFWSLFAVLNHLLNMPACK
jgi:hypothetical protein